MRNPENIMEVAALSPDYMGFIFYEKSKRFVGEDFMIPNTFPERINRVGVFVNEDTKKILKKVDQYQLDYVQLHGGESVDQCKALVENGIGVIKVFSVDDEFDFTPTMSFAAYVDFFLFDTKTDDYGGSGKSFDWNLLDKYDQQIPFFLSGGLSLENIASVLKFENLNLHSLDINSGVELSPGVKSVDKIRSVVSILYP